MTNVRCVEIAKHCPLQVRRPPIYRGPVSCVLCPVHITLIWTGLLVTCPTSTAMPNTFSSLTVSPRGLMSGPLTTISRHLVQNASLPERIMLIEVLISTLSLLSSENFDPDDPISLMLEASIRTLRHLEATRQAATTMQQNMETSLREGSSVLAEVEFQRLQLRGIGLSQLQVVENFGILFESWLQRRLSSDGERSRDTLGTNLPKKGRPTFIQSGSNLSWEWYLSWLSGEETLLTLIE